VIESEARFTGPTVACPHPEWWTSSDDESTEVEVSDLLAGLVRGLQPEFCIETGTAFAQTSQTIGAALKRNGHGRLVSIDIEAVRIKDGRGRCKGLPVEFVCGSSLDYSPAETIDFGFFDSNWDTRVPEFLRFLPSMRPGTVVAFHDTAENHGSFDGGRDLRGEIEFHLSKYLDLVHFPTPRGITVGVVK
jgi:predicted O-methyltransferase YrrM